MIKNNNLFKVIKENDILEIVEDNKDKITIVLFTTKIEKEEEILKICDDDNLIFLIALIDEYQPNGLLVVNTIPGYIIFDKVEKDNKIIKEIQEKINILLK